MNTSLGRSADQFLSPSKLLRFVHSGLCATAVRIIFLVDCCRCIGFGLAIVSVLGSAIHADDWTTYQHDTAHTGRSTASFDVYHLQKVWSAPQGYSTPLVVDNRVYAMRWEGGGVSTPNTSISSFQLADGTVNWTYSGNFLFPGRPTVADGLVVFAASPLYSYNGPEKLHVLDATTGVEKYSVILNSIGSSQVMPTIARDANGQLTAYISDDGHLAAVQLGATSGSVLWTDLGTFGGSLPTIVGNSVVISGVGSDGMYAFDRETGASNRFFSGKVGSTVAYDEARHELYFNSESISGPYVTYKLNAFSYTDNGDITPLWQSPGMGTGGSVAIGPDGGVYAADTNTIEKRDPATGNLLNSVPDLPLAGGITPAIGGNNIILTGYNSTVVLGLESMTFAKTFPGSRGNANSAYDSPGAIFDNGFALDYGNSVGAPGFDVYMDPVPEPSTWVLFLVGGMSLFLLGRRKLKNA